jgi:hypothetical protein
VRTGDVAGRPPHETCRFDHGTPFAEHVHITENHRALDSVFAFYASFNADWDVAHAEGRRHKREAVESLYIGTYIGALPAAAGSPHAPK